MEISKVKVKIQRYPTPASRAWLNSLVFLLLFTYALFAQAEQTRIVDQILIEDAGTKTRIRINFNLPLQYINHVPPGHGDKIVVQLRPALARQITEFDFATPESLSWEATPDMPLDVVRYEGGTEQQVQLGIYFHDRLDFEVKPSPDARSLFILIDKPAAAPDTEAAPAPAPVTVPALPKRPPEVVPTLPALPADKVAALMEEARQAMARGDYPRGIQLYTKILQHQDTGSHQEAQEFLAFARERNGQLAHAKLAYETYLQRYPEGPGADRVRQRLAGLVTARKTPKDKLRASEREQLGPYWEIFGNFAQFYRRDTSHIVEQDALSDARFEETRVNQSSLSNDLDISSRRRGGAIDVDTRFSGGYEVDFLPEEESAGDVSRVSSLYADVQDRKRGLGGRFGRQTRSSGGVLGRFDGALLSYQLSPTVKLNAVSGFPVDSSKDSPDTERLFYGLSADFGTYANAWDFVAFIIEQQIDSLLDRRAIGGEARYFDPVKSLITYLDYDISYTQLNSFLALGNWKLSDNYAANASIDIRKSPVLTTRNAIIGQGVETIDELRARFTASDLRELAEDRTADSQSYTVGLSRQVNERFQVTGDVTLSKIGSTPASGGVEAIPGTGNEYFYNLQLIGSNLIKENDITILGLRYSDTNSTDTSSVLINHRYPVSRELRLNPRFRVDFRENRNNNSEQWIYAPSIQVDYVWRKKYRFEVETGGEWSERQLTTSSEDTVSYFIYLGYRADF